MLINIYVSVGNVFNSVSYSNIYLREIPQSNRNIQKLKLFSKEVTNYSIVQAATIYKSLSIINSIKSKVNIKQLAIYLLFSLLLLVFNFLLPLVVTFTRGYSFNSLLLPNKSSKVLLSLLGLFSSTTTFNIIFIQQV